MGFVTSTVVGLTDVGLVREHNEDAFIIGYPKTGQRLADRCRVTLPNETNSLLLAVSDGMGGAKAGEIASLMTVNSLISELPKLPKILSPHSRLEAAIEASNYAVWHKQQQDRSLAGMGATVTCILIEKDWAYISEVGDSRAYIIRDKTMQQLTNDQTIIQFLLDNQAITPETAATSVHKNMLLQAIGQQEYLQVACSSMQLRQKDIFLLCSDGLSGKLSTSEMYGLITESNSLDIAVHRLINMAKERGGEDNITVVLAQFDGEGLQTNQPESFNESIRVHSRFDPDTATKAQPMRKIREATFQDWLAMAMIDYFAQTEEQKIALMSLGRYGDYIVFRKGDSLLFQGDQGPETQYHYWLVSGRYRVELTSPKGEPQTVAIIVPPTDSRSTHEINYDLPTNVPIRRQFFTASIAMVENTQYNATIWCEDNENIAIRVPLRLYQKVAEILGSRFLNAVKYS